LSALQLFQHFSDCAPRSFGGINIGEFIARPNFAINYFQRASGHGGVLKMKAYWVIDILKDIRQFSEKSGMFELAEQLDDAIFVAASEITQSLVGAGTAEGVSGKTGTYPGAAADHEVH
jgi:hypothetical protein